LARIDAVELCQKSALDIRVAFMNAGSCERFIDVAEKAVLAAGLLFTVWERAGVRFLIAFLCFYLTDRILYSIFDAKAARDELIYRTAFLIERELGKFYVTDIAPAINLLRRELESAITYQTKALSDAVDELRDRQIAATKETLGDTAKAVESTLTSVAVTAEILQKPLEDWRGAINDSNKSQEELNLAVVKMSGAMDGFKQRVDDLDKLIDGYKEEFLDNNKNVERALDRLNEISVSVIDICKNAGVQSEAVGEALEYVRSNQSALQNSMNEYETALKEITASVGGGLGKILDYHTENSVRAMSEGISDSLKRVSAVNNDIFGKLQTLLENILEQSKNETALILNLKEQMEMELGQNNADRA
ncbi:MAG: hypothetical protein LBS19_01355, partial [Clostridiales bacterium]|nr:hypothetical protein [Clostridiales bacterium]